MIRKGIFLKPKALVVVFFLLLCSNPIVIYAKRVEVNKAKVIAKNFIANQLKNTDGNQIQVINILEPLYYGDSKNPELYLFNMDNNSGYVIMPSYDNVMPILAYSLGGHIDVDLNKMPPAMKAYLNWYQEQINYMVKTNLKATPETEQLWSNYLTNIFPTKEVSTAVSPLLETTWDQGCYYNEQCPEDSDGSCNHVPVGCMATAIAQVMKYYNFPTSGVGSHGYNSNYGYLFADFESTNYQWDSMPNSVTTQNFEVAQLLSHVGISLEMYYAATVSSGQINPREALVNHFNYMDKAVGLSRWDYEDSEWEEMVKQELNQSRPLYYRGDNMDVGHAFVCDGYNDQLFHINWGWSGAWNGYFQLSDLTPGNWELNLRQSAIFNLSPVNNLSTPINLVAQLNDSMISFSWDAPLFTDQDTVFQYYRIYRNGLAIDTTSSLSMIDYDVSTGHLYNYNITAVYSSGESNFSVSAPVIIETAVIIPDTNFKIVLNEHCGYTYPETETHNPTDYELSTIGQLTAPSRGITDISGIEYLRNCRGIQLDYNEIFVVNRSGSFQRSTYNDKNDFAGDDDINGRISQAYNKLPKPEYYKGENSSRGVQTDLSLLSGLKKLGGLYIRYTGCSNLAGIENLKYLQILEVSGNNITDASIISNLITLHTLNVSFNPISDASFIDNMAKLTQLDFAHTNIDNISGIFNLPNLISLSIGQNNLSTLTGIENCTKLESLEASGNPITDLSDISNLPIKYLSIRQCQLTDLNFIQNFDNLQHLDVFSNNITDASSIAQKTSLQKLYIGYNPISDLSFLNTLTQLNTLDISGLGLNDLRAVESYSNLIYLNISGNNIRTLEGIENCPSLVEFFTSGDPLYDVRGIENLPLNYVSFSGCQITDFNAFLNNSSITDGAAGLDLSNNPASREAILSQLPILQNIGIPYVSWPFEEPLAACYPIPVNGTVNFSIDDTIRWQANFDSLSDVTYDFYLGTRMYDQALLVQGLTETKYKPHLLSNTNYWWRIETIHNNDTIRSCVWNIQNKQSVIEASFTTNTTSGITPLSVEFQDLSTGNPTNWHWDFGNGNTDIIQNPTHTYQAEGIYSVSLIASDNSSIDTLIFTDYINVQPSITQVTNLNSGWNIISFGILPDDVNLLNIMQPLVDNNKLTKVINESGGFIQYIPGVGWMNTIGNMANTEGYYIKVNNDTSIEVAGMPVSTPIDIPLSAGWNIIGYPNDQPSDAIVVLQPLIDNNELIKVIDEAGGLIQFIPEVGWVNTIGDLEAGEGYYIKVNTNTNLIIDTVAVIPSVTNPITGQTWMDRNLGASRVATSSTDAEAYGDLYQWGRSTDGHQLRTSNTTTTLSSTDVPGHGDFILVTSSPNDWRSPQNDNLWQGVSGTNDPCPSGYRIPTEAELNAERASWSSNNRAGAFDSPLKLPATGVRYSNIEGYIDNIGITGGYWASALDGNFSRHLWFYSSGAFMDSKDRAYGFSIRCIKKVSTATVPDAPTIGTATAGDTEATVDFTAPTNDGGATITSYTATSLPGSITGTLTQAGSGTITITGLTNGTAYTFTVTATNAIGTGVASAASNSVTPTAPYWACGDTIVDPRDGKAYNTVSIGVQCWMAENLNVGTRIDGANNQSDNSTIEKYCYNDDVANCDTYGGLYQWNEMMQYLTTEGVQGICPDGWHVPTDGEWTVLSDYLGGESVAGGKMKETGTTHWNSPNTAGTNESGFTALPGGANFDFNTSFVFLDIHTHGHWWSSTESGIEAYYRAIINENTGAYRLNYLKSNGVSVRCLKD